MIITEDDELSFQHCNSCDLEFMLLDDMEEPIEAYFCPNCGSNIYDEDDEDMDDDEEDEDDDDCMKDY